MAMTLLALIGYAVAKTPWLFIASIALLVITMTLPDLYRPVAKIWLGFSTVLGSIVSKLFLTLVFFLVITPVGLLKKLFGSEPLHLRSWKKSDRSVFTDRGRTVAQADLENPF